MKRGVRQLQINTIYEVSVGLNMQKQPLDPANLLSAPDPKRTKSSKIY